jgi:hypothetical protein
MVKTQWMRALRSLRRRAKPVVKWVLITAIIAMLVLMPIVQIIQYY